MYELTTTKFHCLKIVNKDAGEEYGCFNRFEKIQLTELINTMNGKDEVLDPIIRICEKYNIPVRDLPAVLDEYICNDNDGYFNYTKCTDCRNYSECGRHTGCENWTSEFKL